MRLKIAVVVHGRFHAFDLARALIQRGHEVTVFTNYPKWAVARFGIPKDRVRSFWLHGVLSRAAWKLHERRLGLYPESALHAIFGRWAADAIRRESWDVVHAWSGVSEEIHGALFERSTLHLMMRGSSHIRTQARLLEAEERRTGVPQDRPSDWMIAREEREYQLAKKIVVLSSFAYESFIAEGVSPDNLAVLPLGASLEAFRPSPEAIARRRERILSRAPLRVLFVGAPSFRKGLWDLATVVDQLAGDRFQFRFVGPCPPEAAAVISRLRGRATFIPKQPQSQLPAAYAWGDVFLFPTIEDGYAVVLAQAAASGLPILTTTNCAGPDLIREDQTGWVVPIGSPEALVERLKWCDANRAELAAMTDRVYLNFQPRDWAEVAADFERLCDEELKKRILPTTRSELHAARI